MTEYGKTLTITISSNTNSIKNTAMVIDFKLKLPLNTSYEWKIDIPRPPTSYVDENFTKSYNYIMELIKNYTPKASLERHYKNKLYIPLALILLEDKEKKSGTRYLLVYFPSKDPCSFSKIHVELCKQANNVYNLVRQTKEMKCLEWETVYNTSMKISFFPRLPPKLSLQHHLPLYVCLNSPAMPSIGLDLLTGVEPLLSTLPSRLFLEPKPFDILIQLSL